MFLKKLVFFIHSIFQLIAPLSDMRVDSILKLSMIIAKSIFYGDGDNSCLTEVVFKKHTFLFPFASEIKCYILTSKFLFFV